MKKIDDVKTIKREFRRGRYVRVFGRIIAKRIIGKVIFLVLNDQGESIQLICNNSLCGDKLFALIKRVRNGDIVLSEGETCFSKTNEKSILVRKCSVVRRNLRKEFVGYKNIRKRVQYKKKYMNLAVDQEMFKYYSGYSNLIFRLRGYLYNQGFLEFDTGILHDYFGGGFARPFETYSQALDKKLYLRPSMEIELKQLIASGYKKVFEIGRVFRNEGFSAKNSPEFTILECYESLKNYKDIMRLLELMVKKAVHDSFYNLEGVISERMSVLLKPWNRIKFETIVEKILGNEFPRLYDKENLIRWSLMHGFNLDPRLSSGQMVRKVIEKVILPEISSPTYIEEIPLVAFPLAKASQDDENLSESSILVIDGEFVGDVYTDENDPDVIEKRFIKQAQYTKRKINKLFIDILRFGLPPSAGFGLGVNRLLNVLRGDWDKDIRKTFVYSPLK